MFLRTATLIALGVSICTSHPRAAAAEITVAMLEELCHSKDPRDETMCGSYLLGVMDAFEASARLYGAKIPFCYPKSGLSAQDMSLAFRLWASTNPAEAKRAAISGIIITMVERFPCQQP